MPYDIIVIGASAGGVEALCALVAALPARLEATIFVVLHLSSAQPSALAPILDGCGPLHAVVAQDDEVTRSGTIYVAPPDLHLIVEPGRISLRRGPRENRARPSVDVLFRSAARAYGARVIGVVLTGSLDDGSAGLVAIKQNGGVTVVQDPRDATFPGMPASALATAPVDYSVPLNRIGPLLAELVERPAIQSVESRPGQRLDIETRIAAMKEDPAVVEHDYTTLGAPSKYTCPECNGVLWEIEEAHAAARFRCRVGHGYTADALQAAQDDAVEAALWAAMRALEEASSLSRRLADSARVRKHTDVARRFDERATAAEMHVRTLKGIISQ